MTALARNRQGVPLWAWKPTAPETGVAVLDEIGDLDAPDALDVEPLKLGIEDLRGVRAALAVGMVEVIAHEFEPALGMLMSLPESSRANSWPIFS